MITENETRALVRLFNLAIYWDQTIEWSKKRIENDDIHALFEKINRDRNLFGLKEVSPMDISGRQAFEDHKNLLDEKTAPLRQLVDLAIELGLIKIDEAPVGETHITDAE